jgi:hypothetical protein
MWDQTECGKKRLVKGLSPAEQHFKRWFEICPPDLAAQLTVKADLAKD